MSRNETFDSGYEPFRQDKDLQVQHDSIDGPIWFLSPTQAVFDYVGTDVRYGIEGAEYTGNDNTVGRSWSSNVEYAWTARNNRKGRHALRVRETVETHHEYATPPSTNTPEAVFKGIWRMVTYIAYWDASYLNAVAFTAGCVVLVANALVSFMPYMKVGTPRGYTVITAILNFIGCTLFLASSSFSFTEAVNADRKGCFGWKVQHVSYTESTDAMREHGAVTRVIPDSSCDHHHSDHNSVFSRWEQHSPYRPQEAADESHFITDPSAPTATRKRSWRWLPNAQELRSHYVYDLGFVTCAILLSSSFIYWCASLLYMIIILITGTIGYWIRVPQLIAAMGFTASSALFALETQSYWLRPVPTVIGWQIGFWNTIGSIGFLLCACFGFRQTEDWAAYQFGTSYVWGSLAFMLGSLLQWYESLDKHPVEHVNAK